MAPERRKELVLGAVALVLAVVAYWVWPRTSADAPRPSNSRGPVTAGTRAADAGPAVPDVHLRALGDAPPRPIPAERNLFRFKPKPPPPAPVRNPDAPAAMPVPGVPSGPAPPPPLPPIALKFIGIVEAPEHGQKIAVLSDGRNVFSGAEGATIEGRYRILRIGTESIEMSYLDGRGRQTIRLTGG